MCKNAQYFLKPFKTPHLGAFWRLLSITKTVKHRWVMQPLPDFMWCCKYLYI